MRLLFKPILRQYSLILIFFVMSVISALLEGVGITLIFPLLGDFKNISMLQIPFPLTIIFSFFSEMSVSERFQWVAILLLSIMVIKNIFIYLTRIIISSWEVLVVKHCRMACIHQLLDLAIPYWNKQRSSDELIIIRVKYMKIFLITIILN